MDSKKTRFEIVKEPDRFEIVKEPGINPLRVAGAVASSVPLAFGAGIAGLLELLPRIEEDPSKPLIRLGSLEEAGKVQEQIMSIPQGLMKTPGEREAAGKIGGALGWLFENAAEGWGLIGEHVIDPISEKLTGKKVPYLDPILRTAGEVALIYGLGGRPVKAGLKKIGRGLAAKNLEMLREAQLAKQGVRGVVPERISPDISSKGVAPVLPPKSEFLKGEFEKRFEVEKKPMEPWGITEKQQGGVPEVSKFKDEPVMSNVVDYKAQIEALKKKKASERRIQQAYETADELGWTKETGTGVPENLKSVFEVMKEEVRQGGVEKVGEHGRASLYPKWFSKRKFSRQDFDTVLDKVENGKPLTGRQTEIYENILAAADEVKRTHPDFVADSYGEEGFTLFSGLPVHKAGSAYTKLIGTPLWDALIFKQLPKPIAKIPGVKKAFEYVGSKPPVSTIKRIMDREYRGNLHDAEGYIKGMDEKNLYQTTGKEYAIDLGKRLQAFPEDAKLRMGEFIRGELETLPEAELKIAMEAKDTLYNLGRQAADLGLLSEETFFKNAGKYMPRLYTSKEYQSLLSQWGLKKPDRLDLSRFKQRKDIPKEIRREMGEILTPGYPVARGIAQLTHDIELGRWFDGISKNPEWSLPKGSDIPIPEGWRRFESNKKLGSLSEAYVHPEIWRDLNESIRVRELPEKIFRRALGPWKFGKVILSPKTHFRNLISNGLLAHLGGLPLYEQPIYLTKAAKSMRSKGEYWTEAKKSGLLASTFTEGELRSLFDAVEGQMRGIKAETMPETMGKIDKVWGKAQGIGNKAAKLYEAEEQWFKMAKFIHNVERRKMSFKDASADAEKWLFNYSKLTQFQEGYKTHILGAPFATFTFKAIPRVMEAAIKTPWRFALPAAIIWQMEEAAMRMTGESKEQFRAKKQLRPDWMQGHFLGIPNFSRWAITDEFGRDYNLNLSYITAWGDIGEGGGAFGIPGGLMPGSQPFTKELFEQVMNYDKFWKEPIIEETELAGKTKTERIKTELKKRGAHFAQTMAPTPFIDISKGIDAFRGKPDYRGRKRPAEAVIADVFFGFKLYPVDYADQMQRAISKLDPGRGFIANKLKSEIKSNAVKKAAMQKMGKDTDFYDKKIKDLTDQIIGLAPELEEIAENYRIVTTPRDLKNAEIK